MKRCAIVLYFLVVLLGGRHLLGSVCSTIQGTHTDHYIADPVLHRRWAAVVDCSHPERPWTLKEVPWQETSLPFASSGLKPKVIERATLLVLAGAKVKLWRKTSDGNIELEGTALDAGNEGQTIHVRTGSRGVVLEGKVRGAGSVELFASNKWQSKSLDGWTQ
ncbi:flagella basal body P-ring formation protein FlgA [Alloacidobacterium dinghuense]|uniref:Flagella basal body P-ring formation protein FlgA n=1 Tax=Alloacidobacterium dinghuense TaxID=2763107 RepID=A0A7G8BNM5_9BACT|nr:flagella basal body P-ring formation protein FlgA [Alloacidobacterium dinghuense]QNI34145.1 flagella basal body P-ring formation protein FlgA [Alloacidobacterium dinghuense]